MGTQAHPAPDKPSPCIARQPILAADESVTRDTSSGSTNVCEPRQIPLPRLSITCCRF